ncbi:hypothetical protein Lfu02_70500 [Longispora fulva]|uniref:Uncharacterized protein n=1 Tax=Longispora fulva TaxID=619741 RepID=A0A8J7G7E1_9ACTN|nr:hypothetical protein [Longispora fulva]MBG6134405.1 hypothetical protein [Longispora fulva]GIG62678.1 hypothetical protein Lfu02_70500 [Longispora fulva]
MSRSHPLAVGVALGVGAVIAALAGADQISDRHRLDRYGTVVEATVVDAHHSRSNNHLTVLAAAPLNRRIALGDWAG